jgi:hypothetical protein
MNPLDWTMIAGPLPVILLIATLLARAWPAAELALVPKCVASHVQVRSPGRCWAISGFRTTAGTQACPFFLGISAWIEPAPGRRQLPVRRGLGADAPAYAGADPVVVLAHMRFPVIAGILVSGANGSVNTPQTPKMLSITERAR